MLLRALGFSAEEMLAEFFETNTFNLRKDGTYTLDLEPSRLRGDIATFDILDKKGKVIVADGRRITARHVKELEKQKITKLVIPADYLHGRPLAKDVVNPDTGEILFKCNTEIDEEILSEIRKAGLSSVESISVSYTHLRAHET